MFSRRLCVLAMHTSVVLLMLMGLQVGRRNLRRTDCVDAT